MIGTHAKYTVVLNEILKDKNIKNHIDEALSTYEMYESKSKHEYIPNIIPSRSELNQKLLNHYKYREIGFETVGRFIDELEIAMCEIMPYYNQLMFTQDQDYNIIFNVDYQRNIDTDRTGEKDSTTTLRAESSIKNNANTLSKTTDESEVLSEENNKSKKVNSQTPQDSLNISSDDIDDIEYADEVEWNENKAKGSTSSSGSANGESKTSSTTNTKGENRGTSIDTNTENEKLRETVRGNYGQVSAQRLVLTYRETILNIVQMIITDKRIDELFMRVW